MSLTASAQELERQFCDDADPENNCPGFDCLCVDDTFEVVFNGQLDNSVFEYRDFEPGIVVPARFLIDVIQPQIRGYSFGVAHDDAFLDLQRMNLTTHDTVSAQAMGGGFPMSSTTGRGRGAGLGLSSSPSQLRAH